MKRSRFAFWTLCAFLAGYMTCVNYYTTLHRHPSHYDSRSLLKRASATDPLTTVAPIVAATTATALAGDALLANFAAKQAAHKMHFDRVAIWSGHAKAPSAGALPIPSTFLSTCVAPWAVPVAVTVTDLDRKLWSEREKPYGGCELINAERECRFQGGCSNYDTHHFVSVAESALGSCGSHDHLDVIPATPGQDCVNKTFIPLHLPELLFFGHLDTLMTKLVRIIAHEDHRNALLYVPYHWSFSESVAALLDLMGIEYVTEYPHGRCFARVVWVCHTVSFDPEAAKNMSVALRGAVARVQVEGRLRCRRIYFMRNAGSARNGRLVANETAFASYLQRHQGFCIMTGSEPLAEVTYAVSHADLIAGAHGGALMNLVWLDPQRRPMVMELEGYGKYTKYWLLASAMGFRYGWMSFDPTVGVDARKFVALISKMQTTEQW